MRIEKKHVEAELVALLGGLSVTLQITTNTPELVVFSIPCVLIAIRNVCKQDPISIESENPVWDLTSET